MSLPGSVNRRDRSGATSDRGIVGVLGGMGPLATIDFMKKVLAHSPSRADQDHVPIVVSSIPQIPDRTAAFLGCGASPLEALIGSGRRLVQAGAHLIVMPCNTAHLWYADLQHALAIPMLHIVDAALNDVQRLPDASAPVGLLATYATIESQIYPQRGHLLPDARAIQWVVPTSREFSEWISPAIAAAKAGALETASQMLIQAAEALENRGARSIVMGCTEIPLALNQHHVGVPLIDATDALARQTVDWSRSSRDAL